MRYGFKRYVHNVDRKFLQGTSGVVAAQENEWEEGYGGDKTVSVGQEEWRRGFRRRVSFSRGVKENPYSSLARR